MARCQAGKRVKQCETGFREWEQRVSKWLWIRMDRCVGILIQQSRSFTSNLSHFSSNLSSSPHKQNSSNLSNVISIIVNVSVFNLIIIIIVISIIFEKSDNRVHIGTHFSTTLSDKMAAEGAINIHAAYATSCVMVEDAMMKQLMNRCAWGARG